VRLTVLGGSGVYPPAGGACGGYLVEHQGFTVLIDPGHATVPMLLRARSATDVDAVVVTHGHPDHCVDVNALLRARAFGDRPATALPIHAPHRALDAVLALDARSADHCTVHELGDGPIGPFRVQSALLPHSVPNLGIRLTAGEATLAYTGDSGPCDELVDLARGADLLLCEATFLHTVAPGMSGRLGTALDAGIQAAAAGVGRLVLTHLQPGTAHAEAIEVAGRGFGGPIDVASPGLVIDLR
jgi:ribonuclease BN (tRNA processing enzyme)